MFRKLRFIAVLMCFALIGCFVLSGCKKSIETPTPEATAEVTPPSKEPETPVLKLDSINIESYVIDPSRAGFNTSDYDSVVDTEEIALSVVYDYIGNDPAYANFIVDENGIPPGLSNIKIYEISDRDDIIVISGDKANDWPSCELSIYKDGILDPFPDFTFTEGYNSSAEEIRLVYDEEFPFPIIEIFSYSHQGNGSFTLCRLNGKNLEFIAGGATMGFYESTWEDLRKDSIFEGIGLEAHEYFDCLYEGGSLRPYYEDINGDGYIDIILKGNFVCQDTDYNILLSQEVKRVFLYDKSQDKYVFNASISVRSTLEEYCLPYIAEWIDTQTQN